MSEGFVKTLLNPLIHAASEFGRVWFMLMEVTYWTFHRPFKFNYLFKQM